MRLLFVALLAAACVAGAPSLRDRIKHVVVLMEENRSFDHLLGWFPGTRRGLTGTEFNRVNATDPSSAKVFVDRHAPYVNLCDPNHHTLPTLYKVYGPEQYNSGRYGAPTMDGFVEFERLFGAGKEHALRDRYCSVMQAFPPERVPVLTALAENFVLMDEYFCSGPLPTWPNRLFFLTATANGLTDTGNWYRDQVGSLFTQRTFMDQVEAAGLDWRVYYQDTPWEMFLEGIADRPEKVRPFDEFLAAARDGALPAFAFINPRAGVNLTTGDGSNDMHPDHDVALGEKLYKDVYEALRASPQWNETLFVLTFDEHGGFYDHVPPPGGAPVPQAGEPAPYPDNVTAAMAFGTLGVRVPTLLISPWVAKGATISEPPAAQKPAANSAYEHTSVMATVRKLLPELADAPALTARDAWSATFEHAFADLAAPRTDCPATLPAAPPPARGWAAAEARRPLNGLQEHIVEILAGLRGEPAPWAQLPTQGHFGPWAQAKHAAHAADTAAWRVSRDAATRHAQRLASPPLKRDAAGAVTAFAPVIQPMQNKTARVAEHWFLQRTGTEGIVPPPAGVYSNITIWTKILVNGTSGAENVSYCLSLAAGQPPVAGALVTLARCHPTVDPRYNRDPSQHWIATPGATIRPAAAPSLCVTNAYFPSGLVDQRLTLAPCDNGVYQHYSYGGPGAGAPGHGYFAFGGYLNIVVAVEETV